MATPIITTVTVKYAGDKGYKLPGEAAELFIQAADPDVTTIVVSIKVRDSGGNETAPQTVEIKQNDPLTFLAAATNATVTQDPSQPNHFYVV